ncbi:MULTISPECIES: malonyl transferase [Kitasatospora]|uniref:malonyl transferase n=1 Tax=Kitasatospora TaxID=2063 RepID=UPI000C70D5A1|nr:malonyl transferase [Kitasatospora sp. GP30]MDH6142624.1 [acyl-carrier-protein] S-malonyltransferase [Kitasatospora sp. GP30]
MTLAYILGGGISPASESGVELYEQYPVVRECYAELSGYTGLTASQILTEPLPEEPGPRRSVGAVRQAALALGIADLLADLDVRPGAVGGLSLGGMVSSCLAGSIERRELARYLMHTGDAPQVDPDAPAEGIAIAFVPTDRDPAAYHEPAVADVYLASDFGPSMDGGARMLMLSGLRAALEKVAAEAPQGTVAVLDQYQIALHTPLRRAAGDFLEPWITAMPLRDPALPLSSCLEQRTLVTAEEVRDLFLRNTTDPVHLPLVYAEMKRQGVRLGLVLGPSIPSGIVDFPFPVVHIETPEHVGQALSAIYELGIEIPPAQDA